MGTKSLMPPRPDTEGAAPSRARARILAVLPLAALLASGIAGCNTIAGFGQDVQAAGHAIDRSAEKMSGGTARSSTASEAPAATSGSSTP